jgi:hypothetical protein
VPILLIEHPEKDATPAVVVAEQPDRVPLPGLVPMANVIACVLEVTVSPAESSIVTTGCVPKAAPAAELLGDVVIASFDALPTRVTTGELPMVVRVPPEFFDLVVNVWAPGVLGTVI